MSLKLTDTMKYGLLAMSKKVQPCFALPNANTGRALESRGLIKRSPHPFSSLATYTLTDEGLRVAAELEAGIAK